MVIIIQNDPEVPAGTYASRIHALGLPVAVIRAWETTDLPPARHGGAVIVLGGAMGVHDAAVYPYLNTVKEYIRRVVAADVPFLGICLGGQLLADVAGGVVTSSSGCGEKGIHEILLTERGRFDPLFRSIGESFLTFQWHNDSFDLPPGAVHLASSPRCPVQAFRIGNAYGLQFHPEVDEAIVRAWSRDTRETSAASEDYVDTFKRAGNRYVEPSFLILSNFLRVAGIC